MTFFSSPFLECCFHKLETCNWEKWKSRSRREEEIFAVRGWVLKKLNAATYTILLSRGTVVDDCVIPTGVTVPLFWKRIVHIWYRVEMRGGEKNMKIAKATIFATFQFHMGLYAKEKVRYRQCSWTNDYVMLLAEYLNMYSKCTQWKPFQNCSAKSEMLCNFFPASGNYPQLGVLVNGSFLIHRTVGDMWESCPSLKYANFFNAI